MTAPESWRRVFPSRADAEAYLAERGFSVGRMQSDQPRGVMFGKWDVRKWRDLSRADRGQLHGVMSGIESGAAIVSIYSQAPAEAHDAIRLAAKEAAL